MAAGAPGRGDPRRARLHPALARRTLHGTGGQAAEAARAVAGPAPVKRNRFTALDGAVKSVDREPEARARTPAGIRGCKASLAAAPDGTPVTADFAIGPYHELWNIGKSFRMPEPGLRAGPVCRRRRDSVEARLTAVSAALAVTRFTGARTGWPAGKFVRTARRCRTVQVRAGQRTITAEDPLPPGGRDALALIK